MNTLIEQLKNKQLVWQGSSRAGTGRANKTSGYAALDQALVDGFPQQGVIDIQTPSGIGELRLILPYLLDRHRQSSRLLVMIAPPSLPNSEMLAEQQFALQRILIIKPASAKEALWAAEQCLKSGCCHSLLLWHNQLEIHQVKRLQLAAEKGDGLLALYRHQVHDSLSLPVTLGMALSPHPQGLTVRILKQKQGWPVADFVVDMQARWPQLTLSRRPDNVLPFRHSKAS